MFEELKIKVDATLKLAVVGAVISAAALTAFICFTVAFFVWTQQTYGTLEAWLVLGAEFIVLALVGLIAAAAVRGRRRTRLAAHARREAAETRSAVPTGWLQDPRLLVVGLQAVRMIGVRRLVPILAVGALAAGFLISRANGDPAEADEGASEA